MRRSANFRGHGAINYPKGNRGKGQKHLREKEKDEDFDLLTGPNRNEIFQVVFDYYTPRSHFVILPRNGFEHIGRDYGELQRKYKLEFVNTAMAMVAEYKLGESTLLSVHRGLWLSNKEKFHASVCVGVEEYVDVLKAKEEEIPDWPSTKYVTKEWRASKSPRDFEENVRGYPFKTYYRDELKSIRDLLTKGTGRGSINPSTTYEKYTLLFHSSEPRVGFAVEKTSDEASAEDYIQTLDAMSRFAGENGLTDLEGTKTDKDDKGCHMCLALGRDNHGK